MLSDYPLKIADLYHFSIGNIRKLESNLFDNKKHVFHYENFQLYLGLRLKLKKVCGLLEFNQSQWLKLCIEFDIQKIIETDKNWRQRWKSVVQINEKHCAWRSILKS